MKNQLSGSLRSLLQNLLAPAVFACVLGLSTLPLGANATEKLTTKESPVDIKYLGKINQQPVFQVNVENATEDVIYLTLKDDDGNVMYSEKFRDKKVTRKFQLSSDLINSPRVVVSISSKNSKAQSFEISNVSKMIEDVVVTKVD